ncbi:MAG: hypothetical protein FWE48_02010 [Coriobacteriia bacterium]|nr:hypothetical protein [Coriobacteriia bacterium]MCL2745855.1 hypothetical protein [Coriobacteriia bacterium]MCL2870811.1 hypothetical protein [Coriobacteriia bacterium]
MSKSNVIRKMVAPIVITVITCMFLIGQIAVFFFIPEMPLWGTFLGVGCSLLVLGAMIYVLIERIKEIKSGVEDDLDNY